VHLYFIRHGQSYINLEEWDKGFIDTALTDLGQQQAAALAAWLPDHLPTVDALYTSTLKRALETATPLGQIYGLPLQKDDRLREVGTTLWDHSPWGDEETPHEFANFWGTARPFTPTTVIPDPGESWMHFKIRVGAFIEDIIERHRGQIVLVICHGGVIDAAFDHIFNVGPWRRCETWTSNTSLTYFEYIEHPGREVWRLYYYNRVEHLITLAEKNG
jgi:probable phosphoglycerate mutase